MVLRAAQPILAASAVGTGVSVCNFQNTINVAAHGMDLQRVIQSPRWSPPLADLTTFRGRAERLVEGFDEALLDEVERLGQPLVRQRGWYAPGVPTARPPDWYTDPGYWTAVGIQMGERVAVTEPRLMGRAFGE